MIAFFFEFVVRPLANLLLAFGDITGGEMGLAILFLTLTVRAVLFPISARIVRDQEAVRALEPELAKIRKQWASNRMQQGRELSRIFREHSVSPLRPLLLTLVQLPVLLALWRIFSAFDAPSLDKLRYPFVNLQQDASFNFFGLMPLGEPSIALAVITGALQWASQRRQSTPTAGWMRWFFPAFSVIVLSSLPSALGLYWASSLAFGMLEQHWVTWRSRHQKKS